MDDPTEPHTSAESPEARAPEEPTRASARGTDRASGAASTDEPDDWPPPRRVSLLGGLLALVFPGLGHLRQGERWRGAAIATGVLGLFLGGLMVGGIGVVDRTESPWWFAGQSLVGPIAWGTATLHDQRFKVADPPRPERRVAWPEENPPYTPSLGRSREAGTLACAVAGLVNLVAILDALFPVVPTVRRRDPLGAGAGGGKA